MRRVLDLKAIEHRIGRSGGAAGTASHDLGTQGVEFDLLALLVFFQHAQARPYDLADVIKAPASHLIADEGFEVIAKGDAGGHGAVLDC